MINLSVNINKIATLRNARGGDLPNILQFAKDCERFGADGITVHPRPDERHITTRDVYDLESVVQTEFNIGEVSASTSPNLHFERVVILRSLMESLHHGSSPEGNLTFVHRRHRLQKPQRQLTLESLSVSR